MSNVPTSTIANQLLEIDKFSEFYTEEIQIIGHYIVCHPFSPGQVLMKKGKEGTYLGIVLQGKVNIVDNGVAIATRSTGDLLGEMALVRSEPRIATVVAASEGKLAIISFDDLDALQHTHPHLAVKLFGLLTESTVRKLRDQEIEDPNEYVVLLADDRNQSDTIDFVLKNKTFFSTCAIAARQSLSQLLAQDTDLKASKILDSQYLVCGEDTIGSLIVSGNVLAIVYLRDPLALMPNPGEFEALLRLCDANQIPFATNLSTADAIVGSLETEP